MSHKNSAIGATLILVSLVTFVALITTATADLPSINPIAALIAIAVAVIGIVWFKRTSN
jgi:hypothetical protein